MLLALILYLAGIVLGFIIGRMVEADKRGAIESRIRLKELEESGKEYQFTKMRLELERIILDKVHERTTEQFKFIEECLREIAEDE